MPIDLTAIREALASLLDSTNQEIRVLASASIAIIAALEKRLDIPENIVDSGPMPTIEPTPTGNA